MSLVLLQVVCEALDKSLLEAHANRNSTALVPNRAAEEPKRDGAPFPVQAKIRVQKVWSPWESATNAVVSAWKRPWFMALRAQ